ncbi:MAG: energy-coupling factor transporter transmembrane protein EcfT [Syntrophomonadaceae bacterium]|jgi:energy-coupling factor transport system permease protein|nr:energy-coupling factor transporter transmembrane protein EcfT [Syntrophomonadaceae bacterium]
MTKKQKTLVRLDPRMKCFIVVFMSPVVFLVNTPVTSSIFTASIAMLMFLSGVYIKTIHILLFYAVFVILEHITPNIGNASIMLAVAVLNFVILKFTAIFMLGTFLIETTPVTEIICALETMRMPSQVVIPFAVAVRFIPSIREDFNCLKDSLHIRNISVSVWSFLRRPVQTIEYMLVPILIRSYKISDELAASAMIRGLDSGKPKTILYPLKFGIQDFITPVILFVFICGLLYYQRKVI